MRNIGIQIKVKRLQRTGKRASMNKAIAKKNLLHTMCRYIRWTMKNGGGLMKIYRLDGSFETFIIGLKQKLTNINNPPQLQAIMTPYPVTFYYPSLTLCLNFVSNYLPCNSNTKDD